MSIQRILLLGISAVLLLVAASQLASLWWLQQRLSQEITNQTGRLSQIVLARTVQKIQRNGPAAANSSPTSAAPGQFQISTETTDPHSGIHQVRVFKFSGDEPLPMQLQHELDQTLTELRSPQQNSSQWSRQFRLKGEDSSQALLQQYLRYQLLILAVSLGLALSLALWLGYRFIAPLQKLVGGFRRLANGEHAVQLDPQHSLAEYRFVLEQFNQTSFQLGELAKQQQQLQQQQQLVELGEISRGMVHALRNPIHTMALALEQMPAVSVEHLQLQKLIEQKMQHINRTLTALLTLSCEGVDRSQPIQLTTVLQDIQLEFSQSPVNLQLQMPAQVLWRGAESEFRAMFHALISNAVEASPATGLVQIKLIQSEQQLELWVIDQGQGLSDSIAELLFQPHISSKAEGAGMGLYLCRRLLQRYYQGNIELVNLPEGGCCAHLIMKESA